MLGILAINVAGFAGPAADVFGPVTHGGFGGGDPTSNAAVYTLWFVLFEGKMRALFSILFGASMELFLRRAEVAGRDGQTLQLRRLGWLGVFGYLHWLVWWGDILFSYALAGLAALALRRAPDRLLVIVALATFGVTQADNAIGWLPYVIAERAVAAHAATPDQTTLLAEARADATDTAAHDLTAVRRGFLAQTTARFVDKPLGPVFDAWSEFGEALPYMLIGVVLLRGGLFAGGWPRGRLLAIGAFGLGSGSAMTVPFAIWAWRHGFPFAAMHMAIGGGLAPAHLLTALGYAALLVRVAPALLRTAIGRRIAVAGRMALSNYLGCTLVMTAIFYGWGLGLAGRIGSANQALFVVLGWVLMLGWSTAWLARFRQGPLESVWRGLVERKNFLLFRD